MRIFLVAGKAGSGKNEVAKLIREYYTYKLQESAVTSFSKYITNFTKELTDWDGSPGNKPRDFMQKLGDTIRRKDPYYFTKNMIADISVFEEYVSNLVIADVRMPEEIEEIRNNFEDVYAIYVVNQFEPSKLSVEQQAHITETALENYADFDYTIANDTLESLHDKVFKILEGIK